MYVRYVRRETIFHGQTTFPNYGTLQLVVTSLGQVEHFSQNKQGRASINLCLFIQMTQPTRLVVKLLHKQCLHLHISCVTDIKEHLFNKNVQSGLLLSCKNKQHFPQSKRCTILSVAGGYNK